MRRIAVLTWNQWNPFGDETGLSANEGIRPPCMTILMGTNHSTVGVPYFQTNPSVMNVLFCPLCLSSSSNARTYHGLYSTQVLVVFWGSKSSHKKPSFYLGHPGVMAPVRGVFCAKGNRNCAVRPPLPIREEQTPGRGWWYDRWSWMMLDVWRTDDSTDLFLHIPCFALRRCSSSCC